jgi:hypothetical protein
MKRWLRTEVLLALAMVMLNGQIQAQDLEPRRWTHIPTDVSFPGAGTGYVTGDIFFDPVLLINDASFNLGAVGASYIHSFDLLGKSARIDVTLPWSTGRWQGLLDGVPTTVRRHGFGDPVARLSVNLYGAPALNSKEFAQYKAANPVNTTVGAAVALLAPWGEYSSQYLINLGANRWVVRPQLGILHERNEWQFELTGSAFLFEDNPEFWQGRLREQDPLWLIEGHVVRTFRPGLWLSFSSGYGHGGRSTINGARKEDDSRARFWAISLGVPLSRSQGLKFSWLTTRTNVDSGADLDAIRVAWSLMFGR